MESTIEMTPKQLAKKTRNEDIIKEYLSMQGAKTVICEKVAYKFNLSVPSVRLIVRKAGIKN